MEISKNVALLTFLYFIQGLPYGFQARFLPVFLRSQGLSLTSLGFFKLLLAPWLCKALWAPLVDKYGTKRKWLLWSVFGLIISCAAAVFISPTNMTMLSVVLLSLNLCAATQDIAVDSIAVAVLSGEDLGQGNTAQVVGYKIGSMFGGGVLVWFIDVIGWPGLFVLMTLLYIEAWMFVYVSPRIRKLDIHSSQNKSSKSIQEAQLATEVSNSDEEDFEATMLDRSDCTSNKEEDLKLSEDYEIDRKDQSQWKDFKVFLLDVWSTPGTKWILLFVLVYKLGEQGVTSMLPLYLVDKSIAPADITFWAGMIGQGISILGSLTGGYILSSFRFPIWLTLNQVTLLRVMPMGIILQIVLFWEHKLFSEHVLYYTSVLSYSLLMLLSGMLTTATFTCMMQCSQLAPCTIQATHYTLLASVEVLGKLCFASVCGYLADLMGYSATFLIFVVLSAVIIPLFRMFPEALQGNVSEEEDSDTDEDKNGSFPEKGEGNCQDKTKVD